uniref:Kinase n=2 Tax=Noctiluca scintillans TaxID=2966 RepID=A0A7S1AGT7_NOCSC|mmetsp:Transcript_45736/g.121279  ORF Transcript_45736/g.121279 Transcript_45736/m.121279 type:complete len:301 (+) Transcript_45736:240-1142(+)
MTDPIRQFIPSFHGVDCDCDENGATLRFIRIGNLLHDFYEPKVMDVKLGCRTHLESECQSSKPRPDLFERMNHLYPGELTAAEREAKFITKHRWMTARDTHSTIRKLGFRVDGVAGYRPGHEVSVEHFASMRTMEDTCGCFRAFAEEAAAVDQEDLYDADGSLLLRDTPCAVAGDVRDKLMELHAAMEASSFVARHEFIGSSLLVVADGRRVGVFWIDFAKAPECGQLTHRIPWHLGNHEDGILAGLEKMICAWARVTELLRTEQAEGVSAGECDRGGKNTAEQFCGCLSIWKPWTVACW